MIFSPIVGFPDVVENLNAFNDENESPKYIDEYAKYDVVRVGYHKIHKIKGNISLESFRKKDCSICLNHLYENFI